MTPYDCDLWISQTISQFDKNDYMIDKIIYWRLEKAHNVTIMRDKEWFLQSLPTLEKMWKYVEFFRKNKEKLNILLDVIKCIKKNNKVMEIIDYLFNTMDHRKEIDLYINENYYSKNKKKTSEIDYLF